ncbi:branched-chain-amino-acid aminotransferase TOXF [Phlyctema vagabunda]|uniref:Branched-chain-amino-acid aminotransferase TOXF n=1 Tax=Phlyctema vagabunda TaxID=108571 RepID=A0ABR4PB09_9HELO
MGSIETVLFPPAPVENIDWNRLGMVINDVNGHSECHYSVKTGVWTEPEFVKSPILQLHGLSPALNYGQQVYEGLKAFRSPQNEILIFRPEFHARRLQHSAEHVSIPPVPEEVFLQAVRMAVRLNAEYVPPNEAEALLYIRPVLFGSSANLGLSRPEEFTFCVYVCPGNAYHGVKPLDALVLDDFDRAAPNGTGSAKVGGNYAPVIRHQGAAMKQGYGMTLHLDSRTHTEIDEFSTSGFMGVKTDGDRITLVVPDSQNIIDSVTSDSCLKIGASLGWTVEKRSIKYEELKTFSEVLAVGTAASILPIKSISRKLTNDKFVYTDSDVGPVHKQLSQTLKDIQKGRQEENFGWTYSVQ